MISIKKNIKTHRRNRKIIKKNSTTFTNKLQMFKIKEKIVQLFGNYGNENNNHLFSKGSTLLFRIR